MSYRYLSFERSLVLFDNDFYVDNQDCIVSAFKKLSEQNKISFKYFLINFYSKPKILKLKLKNIFN